MNACVKILKRKWYLIAIYRQDLERTLGGFSDAQSVLVYVDSLVVLLILVHPIRENNLLLSINIPQI